LLFSVGTALAVSPVQKVTELLVKLQAKVEAEGQAEAVSYDKFACFCKETANNKVYAIEQEDKAIEKLKTLIENLTVEIEKLDKVVKDGNDEIKNLTGESETAVKNRNDERAVFEEEFANLNSAIKACKRAIVALQESRPDALFIQKMLRVAVAQRSVPQDTANQIESLLQQEPAAYKYQSAEIIQVLQDLTKNFKSKADERWGEEATAKQAHNLEEQARQFQIKTTQEAVDTAARNSATKNQEKSDAEDDKAQRTTDRERDQTFLDDLTGQCEQKATDWDQRSQTRSAEITALNEAITLLKGDGGQKYGANKKLAQSLIQRRRNDDESEQEDGTEDDSADDEDDGDLMFLQTKSATSGQNIRVFNFLRQRASHLKSAALTALTMRMKKDHFVKVRGLIKDLIEKLKQNAKDEATAKEQCDKDMTAAIDKRDSSQLDIETAKSNIAMTESTIAQLKKEIKQLSEEIAQLNKDLREATELRGEERTENEQTIADAEAGVEAIKSAIKVLKGFYDTAFLQEDPELYRNAKADRDGNTVGDLAPETFSGDYHGDQDSSKGIFGLLDVIQTDYDRTITKTKEDEAKAQTEFETYEKDTKDDIKAKNDTKKDNEDKQTTEEDNLEDFKDALKGAEELNDTAHKLLEGLKAECVDDTISHEERVKRREQEIASLKEALDILEEMAPASFLARN